MAETSIEWTDRVWNPTTGCDRISPGCDNCYALTLAKRLKGMGQAKYQNDGDPRTSGPGFRLTIHEDAVDTPLHWRKPSKVFVNSMSDLFHRDVPTWFLAYVWETMGAASQHTFQILTKRPQYMAEVLPRLAEGAYVNEAGLLDVHPGVVDADVGNWPLPNVWLGTSIESDRYAFRADHLRATPAEVRWLSLEPLLGPLPSLDLAGIDWVVVGGESGPRARPMHPAWVRDIRDRCVASGVPFFFKQWGAWAPEMTTLFRPFRTYVEPDGSTSLGTHENTTVAAEVMRRVGKKAAGRELDGQVWHQFPEAVARG